MARFAASSMSTKSRFAGRCRPSLEALEERAVPASFVVNSNANGDNGLVYGVGATTLRKAIRLANGDVNSTDSITFAGSLANSTISLSGTPLTVTGPVTINGNDLVTIDGNNQINIFTVANPNISISVSISGFILQNGKNTESGGAIVNSESLSVSNMRFSNNATDKHGAAIENNGTLTVTNSTFFNNIASKVGGAIDNNSSLTIDSCTFNNNTAGNNGGAIWSDGPLSVRNSTFSSNTALNYGGAFRLTSGAVELVNNTIVNNRADTDGTAFEFGGGISSDGANLTLRNNIVVLNTRGKVGMTVKDDITGTVNIGTNNIISNAATAGGLVNGSNGNKVGVAGDTVLDLNLRDNGGPTFTYELIAGSPAINAGDNGSIAVPNDQRGAGFSRVVGGTVDIGAFEVQDAKTYVVDSNADTDNGLPYGDGPTTLLKAIRLANTDSTVDTITFASSMAGKTIVLGGSPLPLSRPVSIAGSGGVTIDGNQASRIFTVSDFTAKTIVVSLSNLTLKNGKALAGFGGAIYSNEDLTLDGMTITGCLAELNGGGVASAFPLTIRNSTIAGNSALLAGGGLWTSGAVSITNSTISGNVAVRDGGGLTTTTGSATILNSTIVLNRADSNASGAYHGGGIADGGATLTLTNTIVAGNRVGAANSVSTDDISGAVDTGKNNIVGNSAKAGGLTNGNNGNIVGIGVASVIDPVLKNNGGPTQTHALLINSPAYNAGDNAAAVNLSTDQRGTGFSRLFGPKVDIGAFEINEANITIDPILGVDSLVFTDLTGSTNNNLTISLSVSGTDIVISDTTTVLTAEFGTITDGGHTVSVPRSLFANGRIQINTLGGSDDVVFDLTNGAIRPTGAGSVFVNTGTGNDTFKIAGAGAGYARFITGLLATSPTSGTLRFTPPAATTVQNFLANLESVNVANVSTFDFLTRNGADVVTFSKLNATEGKVAGTSGGKAFIPVTYSSTPSLYYYTSNLDGVATKNTTTIANGALQLPELKNFVYSGGNGVDFLRMSSTDMKLPVAGGQVLFNGGVGFLDTLAVEGDTNYTLTDLKLTAASGGFVRPVNTERVIVRGGLSGNTIDASAFTKAFIAEGKGGADTIIGGKGRNILIGGIGADTITGGDADDLLIGGDTTHDLFGPAGEDLANAWFGAPAYATRVANIKAGVGAGPTALNTSTAPNDNTADTITGKLGTDWFWAFVPNDVLTDKLASESLR